MQPSIFIQAPALKSTGDVTVHCGRDKSLTHRAIMFAALSSGRSVIHYPLLGADCLSTMECFRALGVQIRPLDEQSVEVVSRGFRNFEQPRRELDCGNSGTTARLILGILAAQEGLTFQLTGDSSLSSRPMKRVVGPLRSMGAVINGADDGNFLPITVQGQKLKAAHHKVDKASAQVKSALLLAGLFCEGRTSVELPLGSRDHTERVLQGKGARLKVVQDGQLEKISLEGPFELTAGDVTIPVDPSSAAFFAVLGLLREGGSIRLPDVLDNPTRTGFLKALQRMSSGLEVQKNSKSGFVEPVMTLRISGGKNLKGTSIDADEVPSLVDEIPILAVAAAFASGPSHFKGLEELRVKESDRLNLTAELLRAAGAAVEVRGDELLIAGGLREVKPFRFDSHGDHRLAMAAAILARRSEKPCCILDSECVRVSFPDFYKALNTVI